MFTMGQRLGLGKRCGSRGREARQRGPIITIQRPIRTTTLQSILSHPLFLASASGLVSTWPRLGFCELEGAMAAGPAGMIVEWCEHPQPRTRALDRPENLATWLLAEGRDWAPALLHQGQVVTDGQLRREVDAFAASSRSPRRHCGN